MDSYKPLLLQPSIVPYPLTLVLATILGLHGRRSGSLSLSGAICASALGYLVLANPLRVFGVKAAHKLTLEDAHSSPCTALAKPNGNRDALQVACNALFGTLCAVTWRVLYSGEYADGKDWSGRLWMGERGERWCALDARWGMSKALVLSAVAFWGACAGDTFASELGILSRSPPRLITTLCPVPRGTNGGVSPWGLLVSLLGGLLIGSVAAVTLALENPECAGVVMEGRFGVPWWGMVIGVGGWSGLVGSLVDSLLGATLQQSLYSSTRNKIVHSRTRKTDDDVIVNVPGSGFNLLSNNGVNLVSAAATAVGVAWASAK